MTSGASKIKKSSLGEDDDTVTIWELVSVNLWLNLGSLDSWVFLKSVHIDFVIEMTNVSNDGVVLHLSHIGGHDNTLVSSSSNEDISGGDNIGELLDLVSFHSSLKGADWIALGDYNSRSSALHGHGASFSDITETKDNNLLTSEHDIGGSHETIRKRVLASIDVIELLLGDRVVNINGSEEELSLGGHLVESVNTGGGLLGDTDELLGHLGPLVGLSTLETLSDDSNNLLEFKVIESSWVWDLSGLGELSLGLDTFVDEEGSITTIINENIWSITVRPGEHFVGAVPVLLEGLSLPGEDVSGLSLNDSSGGVVLGGVDVARSPSEFSSESVEGFDENTGLDGHV